MLGGEEIGWFVLDRAHFTFVGRHDEASPPSS